MKKNYHLPVLNQNDFYTNPTVYRNLNTPPTNPDPYVIKYNGIYFCYSTDENGVNVSRSKDLVSWEFLGQVAKEDGKHDYWAPCVIYDNGIFYLYCSNTGINTRDNHMEYLQLYTSADPAGPFTYVKTFFEKFSIDAHVVKDTDGTPYLFYSVNDYSGIDEACPGTAILADRLIDYTELAGEEFPVVLPSVKEEIFEENRFGDMRDWYTVEGAFFLRKNNHAFLIYAANAYVRENYFLGYSRAENNALIPDIKWEKYPDDYTFSPLVQKNEHVEGTGHCSVIQAPNLIDTWLIYHGRNQDIPFLPETEQRLMRIDPLFFSGSRLYTNAPSYQQQDAPGKPFFMCYGNPTPADFDIAQENGIIRKIFKHSLENYVMEWDLSCRPTHMGACYGILLSYQDPANYLELLFDSGKRRAMIVQEDHHLRRVLAEISLSADYNHSVSHNIRILRNFEQFSVYLDNVFISHVSSDISYGRVGFIARYTKADTAFFAVTKHTELYGKNLASLSKLFKCSQTVTFSDSAVCCRTKTSVCLTEIHPTNNFAKSVTCRLLCSFSSLEVRILEREQAVFTILIKDRTLQFWMPDAHQNTPVYEAAFTETDFTLYITQHGLFTCVYLDNHYYCIHQPAVRQQTLELTAFYLDITGYEATQKTEN
ncbi:MAG: glycoside hydrolase family 43 protein [Eubacteriales bacterium]|nr:glycoside hydrolase family 43 protein [Eubacteriales bacterium]